MRIAIIGDGGWGTANAMLLSEFGGHDVTVWGHDAEYLAEIAATRSNPRYLPGVKLPESIRWTADAVTAVEGADIVAFAVPSRHFSGVCASFADAMPKNAIAVSLTKGLCEHTHARMSEVLRTVLGARRVVVLSGPTHAEEVVRELPTAIVAASDDIADAKVVQEVWSGASLRVYTSDDMLGVEMGGAVKNVIAIAAGCSDGLELGDNTRAALMTRGLAEMTRFVCACGGRPHTVAGLSGVGDLIVTCTSRHSRNHAVGERLGRGERMEDIAASMKMVAEGVWNAPVVLSRARELGVDMPITEIVCHVCRGEMPAAEALFALMNRPPKAET